jgi:hypothetical protein
VKNMDFQAPLSDFLHQNYQEQTTN